MSDETSRRLTAYAANLRFEDRRAYGGKDTPQPTDNVPVVLAAAEAYEATGTDFITAAVLGAG